jgi:HAD superfamily hydrolase (TIGR01548 family)
MNANINNKFDGLLWDMDGVIVDVSMSYRKCIQLSVNYFLPANLHCDEKDVDAIKSVVGLNNDWDASYALYLQKASLNIDLHDFVKNLIQMRSDQMYTKIKNQFQKFYLGDSTSKGFIESESLLIDQHQLSQLKNKYNKMGIVTGRPKQEAIYTLEINNLTRVFDIVVAMEDTKLGKPDPEPILKAINALSLQNTIYIGDSPSDVVASQKANIPCIYIGNEKLTEQTFRTTQEVYNYLIKN